MLLADLAPRPHPVAREATIPQPRLPVPGQTRRLRPALAEVAKNRRRPRWGAGWLTVSNMDVDRLHGDGMLEPVPGSYGVDRARWWDSKTTESSIVVSKHSSFPASSLLTRATALTTVVNSELRIYERYLFGYLFLFLYNMLLVCIKCFYLKLIIKIQNSFKT